jgi:hypothetical protein
MKKKHFFEDRNIMMLGIFSWLPIKIDKGEKTMSLIQNFPENMIEKIKDWNMRKEKISLPVTLPLCFLFRNRNREIGGEDKLGQRLNKIYSAEINRLVKGG